MSHVEVDQLKHQLAVTTKALSRAEALATAGQLALEVMHDVKNPIEALGYLSYLMAQEADEPAKIREHLRDAEQQLDMLRHLAGQTLSFVQAPHKPRSTNLVRVAEAVLRLHRQAAAAKQIHLVRHLPESLNASVYTGEILQALSNLIANALDALPSGGTLHLRLRKCPGVVHITVADNGHGIPAEHVDAVCEPFFTTKGESGTGLGLALCQRIIEHHGGRLRLRSSVRPGKSGTIFRISIPA